MKIAIFDSHKFEADSLDSARGDFELVFFETRLNPKTAYLAKDFSAISVFVNDEVTAETLKIVSSLGVKHIACRSAGYNNVDLDEAKKLGITVTNVPEYSPHAVAEHAVALILALNRRLITAHRRVLDLNFSLDGLVGFDLYGKTIGLIGLGKIGSVVARIMKGFGCKILVTDLAKTAPDGVEVEFVEIEDLCRRSDIVSLHVPLNKSTYHIIDPHKLSLMKKGAMLINTSRGGLIDTTAVIESLKKGHLGYLGIDVYEEESGLFFEDHSEKLLLEDDVISRLMTFKNVLITSHQAFLTKTALQNIADTVMHNISSWMEGKLGGNEL